MNNVFSKLSLALCFVFVSILGYSQVNEGCNYYIVLQDSQMDGSDGASFEVILNQGESKTFTIPGGVAMDTIDLFEEFGRSKVVGGSTIEIEYSIGAADEQSFQVLNALGDVIYQSPDPLGGNFEYSFKTNCKAGECGVWGDKEDDFAKGELNPIEQDQVLSGPIVGDCMVDVGGACLNLPLPKRCLDNQDEYPIDFCIINTLVSDLLGTAGTPADDTLKFSIAEDGTITTDFTTAQEFTFDAAGITVDSEGRFFTICVMPNFPPTQGSNGIFEVPIGSQPVKGIFKGQDDYLDSLYRQIHFVAEGTENVKMVANDQVNVSLDANADCSKILTPDDLLESYEDECPNPTLKIQILDQFRRPVFYDERGADGEMVMDSLRGTFYDANGNAISNNKFIYTVTNKLTGAVAWGHILVEDKQAPEFDLPDGEIPCNHPLVEDILDGREERSFRYDLFLDAALTQPFDGTILAGGENITLYFNVTICNDVFDTQDCFSSDNRNMIQLLLRDGGTILRPLFQDGRLGVNSSVYNINSSPTRNETTCGVQSLTITNNDSEDFDLSSDANMLAQARYVFRPTGPFWPYALNPRQAWANDCSDVDFTLTASYLENIDCPGGQYIVREWKATDAHGRSTSATQRIELIRPNIDDLLQDVDDIVLSCEEYDINDLIGNSDVSPVFDCNFLNVDDDYAACKFTYTFKDGSIFDGCGRGAGKFLREWTLIDWCSGEKRTYSQFIEVTDDQDPVINNVTIDVVPAGTADPGKNSCVADVEIHIDAEDVGCSGTYAVVEFTETVAGYNGGAGTKRSETIHGGYGRIENVPVSPIAVDFKVTVYDSCGNSTYMNREVQIVDSDAPLCKVDDKLHVSLNARGEAVIRAIGYYNGEYNQDGGVDEGTSDNCGIDRYEVSLDRDDPDSWGPYVTYSCASGLSTIYFRVYDIYGNHCETWAEILVEDAVPPIFQSPVNFTVQCDDPRLNSPNYSAFDHPVVTDNCGNLEPELLDIYESEKDKCGGYYVAREFRADDASAKTGAVYYRDTIFVVADDNNYTLQFPKDTTINACVDGIPSSHVLIENNTCRTIYQRSKDHIFKNANGACYEIHRKFEIIDWCILERLGVDIEDADGDLGALIDEDHLIYEGDLEDGYQVYIQKISVIDTQDPYFTGGTGLTNDTVYIEVTNDACTAPVNFTIEGEDACAESVDYSYVVTASNGTTFATGDTNEFDTVMGSSNLYYTITWTINDGCGNTATTQTVFRPKDTKKPTPVGISLNSTVMQMGSGGQVEIWASDFIKEVTDNCTYRTLEQWKDNARFDDAANGSKAKVFTCDDLGRNEVRIYVADADGNQNYVTVVFNVQDNGGHCGATLTDAGIAGAVETFQGESLTDVNVALNTGGVFTTSTDGAFSFANLEEGKAYVVNATKEGAARNGVRTDDILTIVRHMLNDKLLDSPYKYIAADANNDGRVSPADLVAIRNVILGNTTEFTNNSSWRFVDKSYQFGTDNPLAENFPERVEIKSLSGSELANFVGIKVGDVTGDAVSAIESRTKTTVALNIDDAVIKAGETYEVAVKAADFHQANAYQFTMNLGDLDVVDVKAGALNVSEQNFGFAHTSAGLLTTAWDSNDGVDINADDVLFSVLVKAKEDTRLSDVFAVNSSVTEAVAFVNNGGLQAADIDVVFNTEAAQTVLFQNKPNPFADETVIGFNLGTAGEATITVFDMAGKVITRLEGDYAAGYNAVSISKAQLNATGVLYYQLETADFSATKKMVILK